MNTTHEHKYTPLGEEGDTYSRVPMRWRKGFQNHSFLSISKWLCMLLVNVLVLLLIWQYNRRTVRQSCGLASDVLFGDSKCQRVLQMMARVEVY
jgi:hypothetical protein